MTKLFSAIFISLFLLSFSAANANSDWVKATKIQARIVDDGKLAIEIEAEKNWHYYYKITGDAGYATEFDFTGSKNIEIQEVKYPPFEVINEYGFSVNAYKGLQFFEIIATPHPNADIHLKITGAVCNEICIPFEIKINHKPQTTNYQLPSMLLLAVLAGFILNLMPCVLPVLSLKVLGVLKQSGAAKKTARLNFLATSAGIITSFLALAALAVSLKSAGMAIGWGLHFQSVTFVSILMVITLLFALSLFGVFHINPPSWLGGAAKNSFASGVLATLLGTSCTAPVLASVVGFALSAGSATIFAIFAVMGIGMALPFLAFAAYPALVNYLPKPGKWMVKVKYFMGVLLLATSAWLGYVLYDQLKPAPTTTEVTASIWQKFDEATVQNLVSQGKTVFVDITAAWCINCKTNKLTVTETPEMLAFFKENNVVLLQGDMTRPAKPLLSYIKTFERYGIPVNVVYGPHAKDGILLPPLLSKEVVKDAVKKAK